MSKKESTYLKCFPLLLIITMKEHKKQKSYYIREYTLRDKSTKSIRVEPWRSFKEEMKVLGITDNDIFQIQLIKRV
ncbi:hypothetical protein BK769_15115 [Bacillus thuringiensis serovar kumamtoensis]|uniref:Uncharacterized protein n=2 Tax=Bacillus TaxID=1386 RepID=A0A9X6JPH6_BACUK|nr:hypothetical protein BK769_15115 [Bacillus thuringiensis serovar kumamtoensis]